MKTLTLMSATGLLLLLASVSYAQMDAVQNQPTKMGNWKDSELAGMTASKNQLPTGDGMNDHLARVFDVKGDVRILKKGTEEWVKIKKDKVIEVGDQILTGKDSFVEIVYDPFFLNVARIDEKTKAEFRSIEPTDLHLEDGSIFSALDGLSKGDSYQISTPTAVAGVRGTHFDVAYEAATRIFFAATIPVDDNHMSEIYIGPVTVEPGSPDKIAVPEGSQITFEGGVPAAPVVEGVHPQIVQEAQTTFQQMSEQVENFTELREEGEKKLEDISDDQKPAGDGNPPGGGDGGSDDLGRPDSGDSQNRDTHSGSGHVESDSQLPSADAIVDTLIPSLDMQDSSPTALQEDSDKAPNQEGEKKEGQEGDPSGQGENVDLNSAMKFLSLGGVGGTEGKGPHDEKSISRILSTLGVSSETGRQMAQDISRAAEAGGLPPGHADAAAHAATGDSLQLDSLGHESLSFEHDFGSMANEQTKSDENYSNAHSGSSSGSGCGG